jgi:hypothetical protein
MPVASSENLAGTYYNVVNIFIISFLHYWALFLVTFHGRRTRC